MHERDGEKERRYWALHTHVPQTRDAPVAGELDSPDVRTVGELFRSADMTLEVMHATLLLDLQRVQRTLGESGHEGVLCWRPNQETPFVLRLASATLSLRHDPLAPLQDRLSLLATDGSLRPVAPDELEFCARQFMTPASPDLVPLLTGGGISETLRDICPQYAACTAQLAANHAAVRMEWRQLIVVVLVGLSACVPALIWGERLTAVFAAVLFQTLVTYLGEQHWKTRNAERRSCQKLANFQDKILLVLGRVPARTGKTHHKTRPFLETRGAE